MIFGLAARNIRPPWQALRAACRSIHWPACPNPSPYDIFGIDAGAGTIDKKRLRRVYYDLVKVYHPDRGTTGDAERFKRIVEAHNILKDDSRRRNYDATRVYGGAATANVRYERTRSPWEHDADMDYWSHSSRQKFDEGLRKNRMWVLKCVVIVTSIIAVANFLLLKQAAETRSEMLLAQTERVAAQLARVSSSRYPDDTPQDVIDRFVQTRQRTLDRYGQKFSYKAIRDGPSPDESFRPADSGRPARRTAREPSQDEVIVARDASGRKDTDGRREPRGSGRPQALEDAETPGGRAEARARRANGEHEGPVAAYFGR